MNTEKLIKEIEKLQIDLSEKDKVTIIQLHFPDNCPAEVVEETCWRLKISISENYIDEKHMFYTGMKNLIIFPATDKTYIDKVIELSKEDKAEVKKL